MSGFLKKIVRFSSLFKVLTLICLFCLALAYLAPFVHPNTLRILPFFGLAYPIFLVITLLLFIIWTIAKSKWAIITFFVLLIGGKLHFRMIAVSSNNLIIPTEANVLSLMTYNVRLFDLYNPDLEKKFETRDSIINYIGRENPDIICFQEFYHQDRPSKFETRDLLIKNLKFIDHHERYAHKLSGRQNFGVSILSKYPLIAKGDVMFDQFGEDDVNYCIYVDIVKQTDTFRIYNVHLQSIKLRGQEYKLFNPDKLDEIEEKSTIRLIIDKLRIAYPKRADQALKVAEHAKTSPYPVIICGDFNDTPMSYTYNQFNRFLTDAFRQNSWGIGTTYIGKVPAGRIDYIFYDSKLNSADFKIQAEEFSDHRAISCKLFKTPPL